MRRTLRGVSTVEVMVVLVAMSIVILFSSGAKAWAFQAYKELVQRERAQLYAAETLEELEAMKLTRMQQDYRRSWQLFLGGTTTGQYVITNAESLGNMGLQSVSSAADLSGDSGSVKVIEGVKHDLYSRLERRIMVTELGTDGQKRLVSVSVYYGVKGGYTDTSPQQVVLQRLYSDQVQPGFAM